MKIKLKCPFCSFEEIRLEVKHELFEMNNTVCRSCRKEFKFRFAGGKPVKTKFMEELDNAFKGKSSNVFEEMFGKGDISDVFNKYAGGKK